MHNNALAIPKIPFTDDELVDQLNQPIIRKPFRRRIEEYRRTVSYAILNDLLTKVRDGDKIAWNTINMTPQSQKNWFSFSLLAATIHKIDTQTSKELSEAEQEIEKQRVYYTAKIKYYVSEETGEPIIVESTMPDTPKAPLNRSSNLMFG